jgi:hypothetical protein
MKCGVTIVLLEDFFLGYIVIIMSNKNMADRQIFEASAELVAIPHAPSMYAVHEMVA